MRNRSDISRNTRNQNNSARTVVEDCANSADHQLRTSARTAPSLPQSKPVPEKHLLAEDEQQQSHAAIELHDDADIIFQCANCQSIVGDTRSPYVTDLENSTVSLKAASNVHVDRTIHVCKTGYAAGCTYSRLICTNCTKCLGKVYASTVAALDAYRSMFSFDHNALVSYRVGSGKSIDGQIVQPQKPSQPLKQQSTECAVTVEDFTTLDAYVTKIGGALNKLTDAFDQYGGALGELRKEFKANDNLMKDIRQCLEYVQNMMLVWDERFNRLDDCEQNTSKLLKTFGVYEQSIRRLDAFEDEVSKLREGFIGYKRLEDRVAGMKQKLNGANLRSAMDGSASPPTRLRRTRSALRLGAMKQIPPTIVPAVHTMKKRRR